MDIHKNENNAEVEEFFKKWYEAFAKKVDKDIMQRHVFSLGNLPWHIFTWGEAECYEHEDAITKLKKQKLEGLYIVKGYPQTGFSINVVYELINLNEYLDERGDQYITSKDFSWTFVKTHEQECGLGPYFKHNDY